MILAFTMKNGGFLVLFIVDIEDWMLLVFTTEEERLTAVFTVEVEVADGCTWYWVASEADLISI